MNEDPEVRREEEAEPPLSGGEMGMLGTGERSPTTRSFVWIPAIIGIVIVVVAIILTLIFTSGNKPKAQSIQLSPASVSDPHLINTDVDLESPQGQFLFRIMDPSTAKPGQFTLLASQVNHYSDFGGDHLRGAFISADGTVNTNVTLTKSDTKTDLGYGGNTPYVIDVPTQGAPLGTGFLAFWLDQPADDVVYVSVNN
ncbi:hypothetical protein [Mycetocola saprophilus]|uniref:hypothetical protein n=1 Tax=Mycetocola saprophilus TaxID=76636 RepID=UPI0004C06578|nr:hypothetical protein [Mycetocola saprophilus]